MWVSASSIKLEKVRYIISMQWCGFPYTTECTTLFHNKIIHLFFLWIIMSQMLGGGTQNGNVHNLPYAFIYCRNIYQKTDTRISMYLKNQFKLSLWKNRGHKKEVKFSTFDYFWWIFIAIFVPLGGDDSIISVQSVLMCGRAWLSEVWAN